MSIQIAGLSLVIIIYVMIFAIGIISAFKFGKSGADDHGMVANRNMGLTLSIFSLAATSVGGAFLAGTSESVAAYGLIWTIPPLAICIGLMIGALFFAKPLRESNYITIVDPLQKKFGNLASCILLLGPLIAETMWAASILIALGSFLYITIGVHRAIAICVSATVALLYTAFGQMIAVAFTDFFQFILVMVGMFLALAFSLTSEIVVRPFAHSDKWLGSVPAKMIASYVDFCIAMVLGSIPWNTFVMRLIACRSLRIAQISSVIGGLLGLLLAIPPALIGIIAVSSDWNSTDYGQDPIESGHVADVLPLVIRYMTPMSVAIVALSAMSAAVMSSMDSIILSSSSLIAHSIYQQIIAPTATHWTVTLVQVVSMCFVALLATFLALFSTSIYGLFILSANIVYVLLLPALVCALFVPISNGFGAIMGTLVGLILLIGGGERAINLHPFIYYPYYDEELHQLFPYKTFAMLVSLFVTIFMSWVVNSLQHYLPIWFIQAFQVVPKVESDICYEVDEGKYKVEMIGIKGHNDRNYHSPEVTL